MHRLHDHNIKNRLENLCGTLTGFLSKASTRLRLVTCPFYNLCLLVTDSTDITDIVVQRLLEYARQQGCPREDLPPSVLEGGAREAGGPGPLGGFLLPRRTMSSPEKSLPILNNK